MRTDLDTIIPLLEQIRRDKGNVHLYIGEEKEPIKDVIVTEYVPLSNGEQHTPDIRILGCWPPGRGVPTIIKRPDDRYERADALLFSDEARCRNCKWWAGPFFCEGSVTVGLCTHTMVCKPSYGDSTNKTMTQAGVLTCDEGGATGDLMPGPDFGCVHFEKKP